MIEALLRKSILGYLRPSVLSFEAEMPEFFQVRNISREAACHANDSNLH